MSFILSFFFLPIFTAGIIISGINAQYFEMMLLQ